MIVVTVVFGAIAGVLLLPMGADLFALAVALRRRTTGGGSPKPCDARLLFLVPAHNEERSVTSCVVSLRAQHYPRALCDVVVIADNCRDRTAMLARVAGAACLERRDTARPGKPQAIAWALAQLPLPQYDAVVIVDADAVVDGAFASGLAATGSLRGKAVQPYNDVRNPDDDSLTRMAAVLAAARYRGAYVLKRWAGLNVPLSAGMAIGTDVLATHGWSTFTICEDWEWYARLTAAGIPISYAADAHLFAEETATLRQSGPQRQRWLAGRITVLLQEGARIIGSSRIGFLQKLDAIAELASPGPAVHLGVAAVLTLLGLAVSPPGAGIVTALLIASLARPAVYTGIALCRTPAPHRALAAFAFLPVYVVWRLGAAIVAVSKIGDGRWVRTARRLDETADSPPETAPEAMSARQR